MCCGAPTSARAPGNGHSPRFILVGIFVTWRTRDSTACGQQIVHGRPRRSSPAESTRDATPLGVESEPATRLGHDRAQQRGGSNEGRVLHSKRSLTIDFQQTRPGRRSPFAPRATNRRIDLRRADRGALIVCSGRTMCSRRARDKSCSEWR